MSHIMHAYNQHRQLRPPTHTLPYLVGSMGTPQLLDTLVSTERQLHCEVHPTPVVGDCQTGMQRYTCDVGEGGRLGLGG